MVRLLFRVIVPALALPAIAGCAVPNVDTAAAGFNEITYKRQLGECYVTTASQYAARGIVGAVVGSGVGALAGAHLVVTSFGSGGGEAAAIAAVAGAAFGSAIGIGAGAYDAVSKETASVGGCIKDKGYSLAAG